MKQILVTLFIRASTSSSYVFTSLVELLRFCIYEEQPVYVFLSVLQ